MLIRPACNRQRPRVPGAGAVQPDFQLIAEYGSGTDVLVLTADTRTG
jgi:hypothetical protein